MTRGSEFISCEAAAEAGTGDGTCHFGEEHLEMSLMQFDSKSCRIWTPVHECRGLSLTCSPMDLMRIVGREADARGCDRTLEDRKDICILLVS